MNFLICSPRRTASIERRACDSEKPNGKAPSLEYLQVRVLPDDALNKAIWRDGVLVVNVEHIEPAYVFLREYVKLKRALEKEYSTKIKQLEVRDQILEELKNAITSGELDAIKSRQTEHYIGVDSRRSLYRL